MGDGAGAAGPLARFDYRRLAEITGGDPAFERELLDDYLDQAAKLLQQVRDALDSGDPAELRRAAHTLKGSSQTVGAEGVAELGAELERRAGDADTAVLRTLHANAKLVLVATEVVLEGRPGRSGDRDAA